MKNKAKLIAKKIRDKNGKLTTVWVDPTDKTKSPQKHPETKFENIGGANWEGVKVPSGSMMDKILSNKSSGMYSNVDQHNTKDGYTEYSFRGGRDWMFGRTTATSWDDMSDEQQKKMSGEIREAIMKDVIGAANLYIDNKNKYGKIAPKVSKDGKIDVGTILYTSWGYEQTNVDFYCVVAKTNSTVKILPLGQKVVRNDNRQWSGDVVASSNIDFTSEPETKRIQNHGQEYIKMNSYSHASAWDGKPKYFSSDY